MLTSGARSQTERVNDTDAIGVRVDPSVTELTGQPAGGLTSLFGLDVRAAVLVILVDAMVFGGDVVSAGIRGGEATIDGVIKTLEELLARLRPARTKGLSLQTVLRMLNDEAR